jgi:hypothetical protein
MISNVFVYYNTRSSSNVCRCNCHMTDMQLIPQQTLRNVCGDANEEDEQAILQRLKIKNQRNDSSNDKEKYSTPSSSYIQTRPININLAQSCNSPIPSPSPSIQINRPIKLENVKQEPFIIGISSSYSSSPNPIFLGNLMLSNGSSTLYGTSVPTHQAYSYTSSYSGIYRRLLRSVSSSLISNDTAVTVTGQSERQPANSRTEPISAQPFASKTQNNQILDAKDVLISSKEVNQSNTVENGFNKNLLSKQLSSVSISSQTLAKNRDMSSEQHICQTCVLLLIFLLFIFNK